MSSSTQFRCQPAQLSAVFLAVVVSVSLLASRAEAQIRGDSVTGQTSSGPIDSAQPVGAAAPSVLWSAARAPADWPTTPGRNNRFMAPFAVAGGAVSKMENASALQAPAGRRRSTGRKVLGGVIGAVGGFFGGGYLGAAIEGNGCHCDDPGLKGALIGAPVGAVAGAILGAKLF
jgi:hypothetical protein